MRRNQVSFIVLQLIILISAALPSQAQSPNASDISFIVSMPQPWTHLIEVEMRLQIPANLNVPNETDLVMPVWTPGSYLIREFERHVQDFEALSASGQRLDWTKVNKNTWRVTTNGVRVWRATYRVYANEFS